MYSLVSAPVLGFDLARLDGGSAVAEVLLRGLSLTDSDLDILASSRLDDWDRLSLWQDVDDAARRRRTMRELSAETAAAAADDTDTGEQPDPASTLAVLERAPVGTVDGLLHCVRHDVLDWTWRQRDGRLVQTETAERATAVLCDAVVAAYLRDLLPATTRRRLAAGWLSAARWLPIRFADLGPQQEALTALTTRLRNLSPMELARLGKAAETTRQLAGDWAPAVHAASWAVYMSGRIRSAAAAQLRLVQAVDDAGIPVAERAAGVWNLLSGTVQAVVVRDILDADTVYRLLDPYLAALGPTGLA